VIEGSASDGLSETQSYGPSVGGVIVGSSSGNQFKMTLPLPADIRFGSLLTALAVGSTSEFSSTITVGDVTSNLAPVITLPGATTINPVAPNTAYTITVSVADEDDSATPTTLTRSINVVNIVPTIVSSILSSTILAEVVKRCLTLRASGLSGIEASRS